MQVLSSPALDFPVEQLLVNPTGKLLAVVGRYELAIVVLPRRGYMKQVGTMLPAKAVRVGAFYHTAHDCAAIAECRWHPLGDGGSSLLVLTEDALLREYDVVRDVDEPQQVVPCTPHAGAASRTRSALSAEDEDAVCAVSLALGADSAGEGSLDASGDPAAAALPPDWLLFTVFVLMRNGDVYALCPFLPKHAAVAPATIRALAAREAVLGDSDGAREPQRRYLAALLRQAAVAEADDSLSDPLLEREGTPGILAASAREGTPAPAGGAGPGSEAAAARLTTPGSSPEPQGPFLLQPAPVELSDECASLASDLLFVRLTAPERGAWLNLLAIAGRDGRVDLALLLEPVEPRWAHRRAAQPAEADAPSLVVYESIDLGLAKLAQAGPEVFQAHNRVAFVTDPLYPDTFFLTHAYGVHLVSMQRWAGDLLDAIADRAVEQAMAQAVHSDVACVVHSPSAEASAARVIGALVLNDVYLSYTFFTLTNSAQLVALELGLRTAGTEPLPEQAAEPETPPAYTSLLAHGAPFEPPPVFRTPMKRVAAAPGGEIRVSADSLRAFGRAAEQIRNQVRDVVAGGNTVQARLELQLREMRRQLERTAALRKRAAEMAGDGGAPPATAERLGRIEEQQRTTLRRVDALLQRLMDDHQPQLSVYERRWFDELARMAREFGVDDTAKQRAAARTAHDRLQKLEHQLELLRPSFALYQEHCRTQAPSEQMLGAVQRQRVENALAQEASLLAQVRGRVHKLESTLGGR